MVDGVGPPLFQGSQEITRHGFVSFAVDAHVSLSLVQDESQDECRGMVSDRGGALHSVICGPGMDTGEVFRLGGCPCLRVVIGAMSVLSVVSCSVSCESSV